MKSRRCRLKGSHEPHAWDIAVHDRNRKGRSNIVVNQVWCNGKPKEK